MTTEIKKGEVKTGDVVMLKCGGPLMVVTNVWRDELTVGTIWINRKGHLKEGEFRIILLIFKPL